MLVIVGHGPSVVSARLGSWLDSQTVVRLKDCPYWKHGKYDPGVWGNRIDFMCATKVDWRRRFEQEHGYKPPLWLFDKERAWRHITPKATRLPARKLPLDNYFPEGVFISDVDRWMPYFLSFNPSRKQKPSVGLCALFCAVEQGYKEIGVIGFDSFFTDSRKTGKWHSDQDKCNWVHDQEAEQAAMKSLDAEIINLACSDRVSTAHGE